jgi:phosphatidylglycerol:prolipoprotein diacylglycerol transferase
VTDVPWAVAFPNDAKEGIGRHPSQLYEAFLEGVVLFVLLAVLWRWTRARLHPGLLTGVFLAGYGIARFGVEFFRQPDANLGFLFAGATMGQLLSLPLVAAGLAFAGHALRRPPITEAEPAMPATNEPRRGGKRK